MLNFIILVLDGLFVAYFVALIILGFAIVFLAGREIVKIIRLGLKEYSKSNY